MSKKLYVGNLSYDTTDETLREFFSKVGTVEEAVVLKDQVSGRSRGFGFVTMDDAGGDTAIQTLNDQELDGRNIKVNEARPKTDRPPRRSFGGGGGGGGFGRGPRGNY